MASRSLNWVMLMPRFIFLATLVSWAEAAIVTYDFNIGWVTANPDGLADRPVIGINGQWPIPRISADVGDRIIVNVVNQLGNQSTSLHFHGLFMNGTTEMDGPSQVSQCPIPPWSSFTYNFTVSSHSAANEVHLLTISRSTNLEHIGTIRTIKPSIPTAYEDPLLSMTPTSHSNTSTMRSLS